MRSWEDLIVATLAERQRMYSCAIPVTDRTDFVYSTSDAARRGYSEGGKAAAFAAIMDAFADAEADWLSHSYSHWGLH